MTARPTPLLPSSCCGESTDPSFPRQKLFFSSGLGRRRDVFFPFSKSLFVQTLPSPCLILQSCEKQQVREKALSYHFLDTSNFSKSPRNKGRENTKKCTFLLCRLLLPPEWHILRQWDGRVVEPLVLVHPDLGRSSGVAGKDVAAAAGERVGVLSGFKFFITLRGILTSVR